MGVRAKMNGAVAKMATKVGISWLLARIRDAAEGDLGPAWKKRYQVASALAPITGAVLMATAVALVELGQVDHVATLVAIGGFLAAAGLVNAAYLTEIPAAIRESRLYKRLADAAPITTVGLGLLWAVLEACTDDRCARARAVVLVLAAIAAKFSLIDPAWRAKVPGRLDWRLERDRDGWVWDDSIKDWRVDNRPTPPPPDDGRKGG